MGYDYWIYGETPIDDGLPLRFEKSHRGRTPLGTKPPSQVLNRIVRTENEKRAFDKKVAKRLAKKGKKA